MATLGELVVKISGDTSGLKSALSGAEKQSGGLASSMKSHMAVIGAAVAGAAAAFVSFKAIEGAISATQKLGLSVAKLSRETGLSTEEASRLLFAFHHVGLGADDASRSIGIFAKKLKGVSDEETGVTTGGKSMGDILADIGVKATDAAGGLRPISELLPELADRFKSMPDGLEKTGLAMQLFGRSGKDMIPLLNQGSEGLKALSAEADKLGVTLTAANVGAIKAFTYAQRDMNEAIAGVKLQIGMALMPVLTNLMEKFTSAQPKIREFTSALIDGFKNAVAAMEPAKKLIGDFFGLFEGRDRAAIAAALFAALVIGFGAVAVSAGIAFIAENAALLGIPIAVAAAVTAITLLVRHWDAVWGAMQAAPASLLKWLKSNWQEVLLSVILGPIYVIVRHWKDIWDVMPAPVRGAMNAVAGIVETVVKFIIGKLADLVNAMAGIAGAGGKLIEALSLGKIDMPSKGDIEAFAKEIEDIAAGVNFQLKVDTDSATKAVDKFGAAAGFFKRKADDATPSLADFTGGLGGAGAAAEKAAAIVDILDDGIISLAEATANGIPAWAAARFEMEATAKELASGEKAWRDQIALLTMFYSAVDAGIKPAAFTFRVLLAAASGDLEALSTDLGKFISDGIISYSEALTANLTPAQQAIIELTYERTQADLAAAEATNRGTVELIKLATVMVQSGVTGKTLAFAVAAKEATEGTLTLTRALDLGLTPAQAATIQGVADVAKAHFALRDAIYAVMVQMATFNLQLQDIPGYAADSVRELYNLGIELGNTGLGRKALDFELAMVAVNSAFGEGRRAAAEFAYGVGTELVGQLQGALGQLLGGPTVETATLQLQIDTLAYQLAIQEAAGATQEQTQGIRDQIAALQAQQDVYTAEHRVMQDRATLADQSLPTEREMKDIYKEMVGYIRTYSGQAKALIPLVALQTTATTNAKDQAQRFADVAKGFADYQFWLGTRIGDASELQIGAFHGSELAAYGLRDALNAAAGAAGGAGSYQSGLAYVPHTMLAQVHPQEAILTAAQARDWRSGRSGGSTGQGHVNYGRIQLVFPNVRDMAGADRVYRGLQ